MPFDELSAVLWRERQLLEVLLFKLETEELLIANGRTRWLGRATREVEVVLDQIRAAELGRAVEADAAARVLGLTDDPGLREIAEAAPEPWRELLNSHRVALTDLTSQIATMSAANREVLAASAQATREALLGINESASASTYDPKGSTVTAHTGSYLVDREM